jgi:hypothetical protein
MQIRGLGVIAPMALFGAGGIGFGVYFFMPGAEGSFHDDMVPQLFGFCLDGFFLVGLLSLFQRTREHAYRRELWLSLRGALRGILSTLDIALLPPNAEPAEAAVLEQDQQVVRRYMAELKATQIDLEDLLALKRESIEAIAMIRDMVPIAAQLSAQHMRWWIAIVNSTRLLSQAQTRESVEQSLFLLLENIAEFDGVHY